MKYWYEPPLLNPIFAMEKPTNNAGIGSPFPEFSTHCHEATGKAADSLSTSSDDIELLKERRRIFRARLGDMAQWAGQPAIQGSTESMRMALLTFSIIGIQYVLVLRRLARVQLTDVEL